MLPFVRYFTPEMPLPHTKTELLNLIREILSCGFSSDTRAKQLLLCGIALRIVWRNACRGFRALNHLNQAPLLQLRPFCAVKHERLYNPTTGSSRFGGKCMQKPPHWADDRAQVRPSAAESELMLVLYRTKGRPHHFCHCNHGAVASITPSRGVPRLRGPWRYKVTCLR